VRDAFARAGWVGERLLWMRRTGSPPGPREPAAGAASPAGASVRVEEVPFAATRDLRARWHRGEAWSGDDAAVERFLVLEQAVAERRRPRAFAVRDGDALAGFVSVWAPDGEAMEVEQAYVVPERRSDGLGAALVAAALRFVPRPVQWIVADDDGRPKRLYARLGFTPAWVQHGFVRRPRPSTAARP
jgi:GNAT superfamily N-acetyltransferase